MSLDEARSQLSTYEAALVGASGHEIGEALLTLVQMFPRSVPQGWDTGVCALYLDLLSDVPSDLLQKAIRRALKVCEFFPTVAKIREQIAEELSDMNYVRQRLGVAVRAGEREQRERQERRRLLEERKKERENMTGVSL